MLKRSLILLVISSILLVSGCSGPKHDLGGFLGELSCLTAQTDGQTSTEDIAQVGQNHGFETEVSVKELVASLDQDELDAEVNKATKYISANCQAEFDNAGINATEFLTEVLADY
jgi:hypothetical protein